MSTLNPILMVKNSKTKTVISLNGESIVTAEDSTIPYMGLNLFDYLKTLNNLTDINLNTSDFILLQTPVNYFINNPKIVNFKITSSLDFPNNVFYNKFQRCTNLEKVIFDCNVPSLVGNIGDLFQNCPNIKLLDLSKCTVVTKSSALYVQEDTVIVVPDELYDSWVTTVPWSDVASHIVRRSTYYNE